MHEIDLLAITGSTIFVLYTTIRLMHIIVQVLIF